MSEFYNLNNVIIDGNFPDPFTKDYGTNDFGTNDYGMNDYGTNNPQFDKESFRIMVSPHTFCSIFWELRALAGGNVMP
jgi:hypothetical protein